MNDQKNTWAWALIIGWILGVMLMLFIVHPAHAGTDAYGNTYVDIYQTPSATPTATASYTPTASYTATTSYTPSNTPANTSTYTPTWTPTATTIYSATHTYTFTATFSPTPTPNGWNGTPTTSATFTPTFTATWTYTPTPSYTFTVTPVNTATYTPTFTYTATTIYSSTFTYTPTNSYTPTAIPTYISNVDSITISFAITDGVHATRIKIPAQCMSGACRINWVSASAGSLTVGGLSYLSASSYTPLINCDIAGPYTFNLKGFPYLYLLATNAHSTGGQCSGYVQFFRDSAIPQQFVQHGAYIKEVQAPTNFYQFGPITGTAPITLLPAPTTTIYPQRYNIMSYRIWSLGNSAAATAGSVTFSVSDTSYNTCASDTFFVPSAPATTKGANSDTGNIPLGPVGFTTGVYSSPVIGTLSAPLTSGGVYIWLETANNQNTY